MTKPGLILEVLSALVDDDESPWILHPMVRERTGNPDLGISELLATLEEIEGQGWAYAWAPTNDDPEHPNKTGPPTAESRQEALDAYKDFVRQKLDKRFLLMEYGPWYHLTPAGEAELQRLEREADGYY